MVLQRGLARLRAGPVAALTVPRTVIHCRSPRVPYGNKKYPQERVFFVGAPAGTRTPDTLLKRQVLYLLSYWGGLAGMAGLEPTISESKSGVLPLHYIPISLRL